MKKEQIKLPPGWAYCCIADVVAHDGIFTDGDWVESKDQDPKGNVRLIQLADVGDGNFLDKSARFLTKAKAHELNCTFLRKGDLLIARMPEPLGRCCIFPLDGSEENVTVVDVCAVRLGSSPVDPKYMMYLINSPKTRTDIEALKSGSTRKRISRKNLATIQMPLAPKNEQLRIVAKIEELFSELDKGIESLLSAREQLKVYRQAALKHAFEGKLTERWRRENKGKLETTEQLLSRVKHERDARYQQQLNEWETAVKAWEANGKSGKKPRKPPKYKDLPPISENELAVLPGLPKDWTYARLAEISQIGSGMSVSKDRTLQDPIDVPYLRVANVQRGELILDEIKTMPIERQALNDLALKKWDVLFNEGGDRDKLGRGWIWEGQVDPCITQNHVFRATTYLGGEIHSKFVSHWGNTFGRDYFEKGGKQTTNLASINKTVLSMFPVPIASLEEQHKIIEKLDDIVSVLDSFEIEIERGLTKSKYLRQAILKKAFSGQLVEQDTEDESASILLEQISAEKAMQKNNNKKRTRKEEAA
ncbi:MAG: restriction endonuclease subunit S [Candidatus Thiodiazotropha sp.]